MMGIYSISKSIEYSDTLMKLLFVVESLHQVMCDISVYRKETSILYFTNYLKLSIDVPNDPHDLEFIILDHFRI